MSLESCWRGHGRLGFFCCCSALHFGALDCSFDPLPLPSTSSTDSLFGSPQDEELAVISFASHTEPTSKEALSVNTADFLPSPSNRSTASSSHALAPRSFMLVFAASPLTLERAGLHCRWALNASFLVAPAPSSAHVCTEPCPPVIATPVGVNLQMDSVVD